jgi:hypothetical protein
VRAAEPFAVGFESFEQHVRVRLEEVIAATADTVGPHPFARGSVKLAAKPRPLLDLTVLFAAVAERRKGASKREDP